MGHPGGSHNTSPQSAKFQTRRHQGTCMACQSHRGVQLHTHGRGGVGWTCLTLMQSVKVVFFLDIKGSKSHKFEKQTPAISFLVQAGGSELLPFTSKVP